MCHLNPVKANAGKLHMADFLNAVRTRQPPGGLIEDAFQSTVAVKLAMDHLTGSSGTRSRSRFPIPQR